jgi:hypothetical protein
MDTLGLLDSICSCLMYAQAVAEECDLQGAGRPDLPCLLPGTRQGLQHSSYDPAGSSSCVACSHKPDAICLGDSCGQGSVQLLPRSLWQSLYMCGRCVRACRLQGLRRGGTHSWRAGCCPSVATHYGGELQLVHGWASRAA